MIFSPSTQHALRALIHLARSGDGAPVHSRVIAAAEAIPGAFLAKILHRLRVQGLLRSVMGPRGGYALARPAGDISVHDIFAAFDDAQALSRSCLLGFAECSDQDACALHERWKSFRNELVQWMSALTLEEVAARLETRAAVSRRSPRAERGERGPAPAGQQRTVGRKRARRRHAP